MRLPPLQEDGAADVPRVPQLDAARSQGPAAAAAAPSCAGDTFEARAGGRSVAAGGLVMSALPAGEGRAAELVAVPLHAPLAAGGSVRFSPAPLPHPLSEPIGTGRLPEPVAATSAVHAGQQRVAVKVPVGGSGVGSVLLVRVPPGCGSRQDCEPVAGGSAPTLAALVVPSAGCTNLTLLCSPGWGDAPAGATHSPQPSYFEAEVPLQSKPGEWLLASAGDGRLVSFTVPKELPASRKVVVQAEASAAPAWRGRCARAV